MPERQRKPVFISYSRKDKRWLDRLTIALQPYVRQELIEVWDDTKIKPGDKWQVAIEQALTSASVAVLLVSQNFLASDFIARNELPPLLEAEKNKSLKILWIAVSASAYQRTPIVAYQAVNDPSKPLDSLTTPKRNAELVKIADAIMAAAGSNGTYYPGEKDIQSAPEQKSPEQKSIVTDPPISTLQEPPGDEEVDNSGVQNGDGSDDLRELYDALASNQSDENKSPYEGYFPVDERRETPISWDTVAHVMRAIATVAVGVGVVVGFIVVAQSTLANAVIGWWALSLGLLAFLYVSGLLAGWRVMAIRAVGLFFGGLVAARLGPKVELIVSNLFGVTLQSPGNGIIVPWEPVATAALYVFLVAVSWWVGGKLADANGLGWFGHLTGGLLGALAFIVGLSQTLDYWRDFTQRSGVAVTSGGVYALGDRIGGFVSLAIGLLLLIIIVYSVWRTIRVTL